MTTALLRCFAQSGLAHSRVASCCLWYIAWDWDVDIFTLLATGCHSAAWLVFLLVVTCEELRTNFPLMVLFHLSVCSVLQCKTTY